MTLLFRASRALLLPRGRYSSMLDMGGSASAETNTSLNVGKNNKVQSIVLDFDLITRAIDKHKKEDGAETTASPKKQQLQEEMRMRSHGPNRGMVEDIASLLNIKLGGDDSGSRTKGPNREDDDLSRLTGLSSSDGGDTSNIAKSDQKAPSNFNPASSDIRSKYASKLRSKVEGGLAGVELAKSMKEETLSQGDAAAGHFIARSIAASNVVSKSGSKWMATTGAGTLCTFLSNRSMKIALMPRPGIKGIEEQSKTKEAMKQLAKQLPQVKFSLLGLDKDSGQITEAGEILSYIVNKISAQPISTVVVSDRDDILKCAKEIGTYTCRVRKKNEPRGNITTSYTVEDVREVEDVVNELNGISYNTVFKQ